MKNSKNSSPDNDPLKLVPLHDEPSVVHPKLEKAGASLEEFNDKLSAIKKHVNVPERPGR